VGALDGRYRQLPCPLARLEPLSAAATSAAAPRAAADVRHRLPRRREPTNRPLGVRFVDPRVSQNTAYKHVPRPPRRVAGDMCRSGTFRKARGPSNIRRTRVAGPPGSALCSPSLANCSSRRLAAERPRSSGPRSGRSSSLPGAARRSEGQRCRDQREQRHGRQDCRSPRGRRSAVERHELLVHAVAEERRTASGRSATSRH
jgi:hypothetical protein